MKYFNCLLCFLLFSGIVYCQYPDAVTIKINRIKIIEVSGMSGTDYRMYDENGFAIKGAYDDIEFKKPNWTNTIFYNKKGLPDSIIGTYTNDHYIYDDDGSYKIISINKNKSDTAFYAKDKKIKEQRGSDGTKTKYEYNAKGQLIKSTNTNGEGKSVTTYLYNALGLIQSEKTTGDCTGSCAAIYTYDKKGLLIKEVNDYGGGGSKFTTEYSYIFRPSSSSEVQTVSITVNETTFVVNGINYNAGTMLAGNVFKALGTPDKIDTLPASLLKSINDYNMATLNKYVNKGIMLKQGKRTERINEIIVFPNADPSKKFIDYINTSYPGKLTVLGLKIDSNTTIKQVQQFMSKYKFELYEEYNTADLTVFDKAKSTRLLEVKFFFTGKAQKIERMSIKYYPSEPIKKHLVEYKDGNLYLNNVLLDSSTNKTTQLKKILGAPNSVMTIPNYMSTNGYTYNADYYLYNDISGVSFVENPANNGLLSFMLNFLTLRTEHDLSNPIFNLILNKKPFNPEKAVTNGPKDLKSIYLFDSITHKVNESKDATIVTAFSKNGQLDFEFAGNSSWEKRVYYVSYHLNGPPNMVETKKPVSAKPALYINNGEVWLQKGSLKKYWTTSIDASLVFSDIIGKPSPTEKITVTTYPAYGMRMWATDSRKLSSIQFYMAKYMNPYSGMNDAPGVFTGVIEIEGNKLTTESTLNEVQQLLDIYKFKKAYDDANHNVLVGQYNGVKLYVTFLNLKKTLISVAVYK